MSSNFERYLFHLFGDDPVKLRALMEAFEGKDASVPAVTNSAGVGKARSLKVTDKLLKVAREDFLSERSNTEETLALIKEYNEVHNYLYCPHSAIGKSSKAEPTSAATVSGHRHAFERCLVRVPVTTPMSASTSTSMPTPAPTRTPTPAPAPAPAPSPSPSLTSAPSPRPRRCGGEQTGAQQREYGRPRYRARWQVLRRC